MNHDDIKLFDAVRIKRLSRPQGFENDGVNQREPRVGDVAYVIEIYTAPIGYELECSDADGVTEWLCSFSPADIELEKIS